MSSVISPDDHQPFDVKSFLANLTVKPGVYQMLDSQAEVIYVGKAKNLKNRVSSYFRATGLNNKTVALVSHIASIQVTVTGSEVEALVLEQNLIKSHRPKYNILMRDDKSYPYVHLSSEQAFPRLSYYRGKRKKTGDLFGPFPSAMAVKDSLNLLQKVFKVRQCEDATFKNRSRPCLQHQIGRCSAPCVGLISESDYAEDVRRTRLFLSGRDQQLMQELGAQMEQQAEALAFEDAATTRDQIVSLQAVQQGQAVEQGSDTKAHVFAIVSKDRKACVQVLFIDSGKVVGSRAFYPRVKLEELEPEILSAFIAQFYLSSERDIPSLVITDREVSDQAILAAALSGKREHNVQLIKAQRGARRQWVELAQRTAEQNLIGQANAKAHAQMRLSLLTQALSLETEPTRMECFDISHSHGERTVASCVVFDQDGPLKQDYRLYNIDGITGGDDYAAMRQALSRRFAKSLNADAINPDVLFIDGGKGQVRQAVEVLGDIGLTGVEIIGVTKGEGRKAGLETLVVPRTGQIIDLADDSPALHLIQHIRDEAHRFAISGHKARRDKARKTSTLEGIDGIGAKRRKALLQYFGGLQGVQAASLEELCKVPLINAKVAQKIYDAIHR